MGLQIQIDRKNKPSIRTVRFPLEYSDTKIPHPASPPELGEHNTEFLTALGYNAKQIGEFKQKGVI